VTSARVIELLPPHSAGTVAKCGRRSSRVAIRAALVATKATAIYDT